MATYNFTESGNYIYIAKSGDDGNYNGAKADVRAFIVGKATPTQVQFSGLLASPQTGNQNNRFLLSECEIGGVAATEESMQTFIDTHTGGKPSAGDSAGIFAGFISQTEIDPEDLAPTVDIVKNNLGTPAYSYVDVGRYQITIPGAFPEGKTSEFSNVFDIENGFCFRGFRVSDDVYEIQSRLAGGSDLSDSKLSNTFFKIEIFN